MGIPELYTKDVTTSSEFPLGQWQLMAALKATDASQKTEDTILVLGFMELVERREERPKSP